MIENNIVFYHNGRRLCLNPMTFSAGQGLHPSGAQGSSTSTRVAEFAENNEECLLLFAWGLVETQVCDLIQDLVQQWRPCWDFDQPRRFATRTFTAEEVLNTGVFVVTSSGLDRQSTFFLSLLEDSTGEIVVSVFQGAEKILRS